MAVSLTVLGSRDGQLEELVRASGRISTLTWLSDLGTLTDPRAAQPDVLLVDVRRSGQLPSTLTALKRQHPATNVMLLASSLEPALMLEGMRAGVNEVLAEPLRQTDFDAAMTRLLGQRKQVLAVRSSPSSVRKAAWARPPRRSTSRPCWRSCRRARRCSSTCTWPTAMRQSSSAPMRDSRCSTRSRTCIGSTPSS